MHKYKYNGSIVDVHDNWKIGMAEGRNLATVEAKKSEGEIFDTEE